MQREKCTVTFRLKIAGRYWKVRLEDLGPKLDGECSLDDLEIAINPNQPAKEFASTFLHEVLHAIAPTLTEKRIRQIEDGLFPLLWKDGWRPSIMLRRGSRRRKTKSDD